MTEGLLWGRYGIIHGDIAVLVNNTLQLAASGIVVAFKLSHMARHKKQSEPELQVVGDKR